MHKASNSLPTHTASFRHPSACLQKLEYQQKNKIFQTFRKGELMELFTNEASLKPVVLSGFSPAPVGPISSSEQKKIAEKSVR